MFRFLFEFEKRLGGISVKINNTYRQFWWKPYCPGYLDKDGYHKTSKRFQYLKFKIK